MGADPIIRFPAALTINEAVRGELADMGTANLRNENIRQFHAGEAAPRYGFTFLPSGLIDGTSPTTAYKLFSDHNTVCRIADGTAQVFDSLSAKWKALTGRPSECASSLIELPSLGDGAFVQDVAITNGYACVAWLSTNSALATGYAYAAIVNMATGAIVSPPSRVGSLTNNIAYPALATSGNSFILVRQNTAGGTIQAYALDTTSGATINTGWVAMADLASDYSGNALLAVCSMSGAAAVAYVNNSAGTSQLTVVTFTSAGVVASQAINTSGIKPTSVAIQGSYVDTLWVAWDENLNVRLMGLNPTNITLAALATTSTIVTTTATSPIIGIQSSATAGQGRIWASDGLLATTMASFIRGFQTTAGAVAANGSQITIYAVWNVGHPTMVGSRYYIPVISADPQNLQQQVTLVDWTDDVPFVRPVGNPASGLVKILYPSVGSIATGASGVIYYGINVSKSAVSNSTALAVLDFNATTRWQSVSNGGAAALTGGVLQYSDGRRIAELGFLVRPPQPTTTTASTGITAVQGWRYVCVYEEVDADGNWCVSGLSAPSASTGAVANKTVSVSTLPLTVTSRMRTSGAQATGVRVAFYRTLDGGVSPYYRLGAVVNDPTLAAVTYADATSDANLSANSELYSQPGVLGTAQDRRAPPGLSNLVSYNGMLVGSTGSDVWFSGQPVSGEATWFNPVFQVPVPGNGDIMALAVMDGGLFVFKQREVYAIVGSPPSDNGATGGLGTPVRLACDVGCIEPRSIATTALGTFFQSDRGIELLTRAQTVMWVGQKIQQTLAKFPIVTSATVQPTPSGAYVLIELAASQSAGVVTGNGRTLVYDLSLNDWVSIDNRDSATGATTVPSQSACMIYTGTKWAYAWMSTDGYVHWEDPTRYTDADNTFVPSLIETGWYNAYQNETDVYRATIRYQRYTAAGIQAETAYDWNDYDGDPESLAAWSEDDTTRQNFMEWTPKPRGEAMKFRITTTAPATANLGTGQGLGLISISLDLEEKQGPTKGTLLGDPALRK